MVEDPPDDGTSVAPSTQRSGMAKASAVVAMGTGLSRITGLVRVGALTYALGRTVLSDSYNLANIAPNLIYELLLGGVLSATLIPLFVDANESDDDETPAVLMTVCLVALVIVSVGSLLLIHGAEAVFHSRITAGRRTHSAAAVQHDLVQLRTVVALADLLVPQILFYGLTTLATAALNARRIFKAPAFAPVLNNLITSAMLVASVWVVRSRHSILSVDRYDSPTVLLLGIGTTAGVAAMSLVLIRPLRDVVGNMRWRFEPRHRAVRAMIRLSGWTVGYVIANQIALAIVYALAVRSGEGTLTAYTTAFIFFQLPHGLFAVSIMTTYMPELAIAASADDHESFRRSFLDGLRMMMLVILPAAIGYLLLAKPLISILLQRGNFHGVDAEVTGRTLAMFAVGLPGFSLYLYALRAFYAGKDTRTPFMINAAENAINVILAFALMNAKSPGLALAYSLAYVAAAALAFVRLDRGLGGFGRAHVRATLDALARMLAACAAMALGVWLVTITVGSDHGTGALIRVGASIVVGVGIYGAAITVLRVEEARQLADRITSRLRG